MNDTADLVTTTARSSEEDDGDEDDKDLLLMDVRKRPEGPFCVCFTCILNSATVDIERIH